MLSSPSPFLGTSHRHCSHALVLSLATQKHSYEVDSVATTTFLERTQQGQFILEDSLEKDDWTVENICAAIDQRNEIDRAIQES